MSRSQHSPEELEQRAERAVRRGELLAALESYEEYLAARPDDDRVRLRMEAVRSLLQPSELVSRRRVEPEPAPETDEAVSLNDAEQGELHASAGRLDEAVQCYERALAANQGNDLLRERLDELRGFAHPARARLDGAERLEPTPPERPGPATRSTRASEVSFSPSPPIAGRRAAPAAQLPREPRRMLEELLARVRAAGRRSA